MRQKANRSQIRALYRLPMTAGDVARDSATSGARRRMWVRLIDLGWAEWVLGPTDLLRRTPVGTLACCRTRQAWEDEFSSQLEAAAVERAERGDRP